MKGQIALVEGLCCEVSQQFIENKNFVVKPIVVR